MLPTEPIGSIPRPAALIAGIQGFRAGRISQPELKALYDAAAQDTIRRLEATGSPVTMDGEQAKHSFATSSIYGRSTCRRTVSRASVARAPCDLAGVIGDVVPLVDPELGRHGIMLQTALAPGGPPVMGDRIQLQQVLLNLLMNGAAAVREVLPERRRLVVRSTVEHRDDGPWAVVALEDAGVGFPEDAAARLFDAFYTTKPGGLGMGLSISRSIIDGHGGRLWATANVYHGATFHFALPGMR